MATSESDDFESADEELDNRSAPIKRIYPKRSPAVVDSDTDDDTGCTLPQVQSSYKNSRVPNRSRHNFSSSKYTEDNTSSADSLADEKTTTKKYSIKDKKQKAEILDSVESKFSKDESKTTITQVDEDNSGVKNLWQELSVSDKNAPDLSNETKSLKISKTKDEPQRGKPTTPSELSTTVVNDKDVNKSTSEPVNKIKRERPQRQQKQREPKSLGGKKLGHKVATEQAKPLTAEVETPKEEKKEMIDGEEPQLTDQCWKDLNDILSKPSVDLKVQRKSKWDPVKPENVEECWEGMDDEIEIPEELKSDKKFKEVFKSEGWDNIDEDVKIPEEMTEEKILPVLDKLSLVGEEQDKSGGWGWGGWGVSSLINTASAGVTTLTNHVSQGLTMLEESMGVPDPEELAKIEENETNDKADESNIPDKEMSDTQLQTSFGFGNLISSVSSITKLVESTSNKVIAGGLDTLETIGKKTMEVLQDGDPGLKKKRAFFTQDKDKPILSQILREAKDKAETEEKTLEEKQLARKVHFESLFDDYQGLVHLEALEMLSKQCDIKIQQHMINLNADELYSVQEMLEEVKELCDLGDEDEEETDETDLRERLKGACKDLGVNMTYDKLLETWEQTKLYLSTVVTTEPIPADREVFQRAISTLAQFTALSVERFHKTAELLLVKERRSTVNEADALVQFTNILSSEIGVIANWFADKLNERVKHSEKPEAITANITTIFLEAANASSYIQDAFKLLIPVLQVGAT